MTEPAMIQAGRAELGRPAAAPVGPQWYRDLSAGWLRALARRGRARRTLRTYGWLVRSFGAWLEHCRIQQPEHLVREVVYGWQDELLEAQTSAAARQLAASVVRGLLRWGAREGYGIPAGLWEHVETPTRPRQRPRPLQHQDLARLLEHLAGADRTLEQLRDRALFLFLLTSGSRISAALSLTVEQARAGDLVVVQKGGDEHALVPSARARAWLAQYLQRRGRDGEPALWIRIGTRGRHRLYLHQVNAIWAGLCDELRIPRFTSHVLRHTAATEYGERGWSDAELAAHMGWRSNQMATQYRDLRADRRQRQVDQLDELVPDPPPAPARRRRPASMRVLKGRGRRST